MNTIQFTTKQVLQSLERINSLAEEYPATLFFLKNIVSRKRNQKDAKGLFNIECCIGQFLLDNFQQLDKRSEQLINNINRKHKLEAIIKRNRTK